MSTDTKVNTSNKQEDKAQKQEVKPETSTAANNTEPVQEVVKVYVGNLPYTARARDVRGLFDGVANVGKVRIVTHGRKPAGFGFATLEDPSETDRVVKALQGTEMRGRALTVERATGEGEKKAPTKKSKSSAVSKKASKTEASKTEASETEKTSDDGNAKKDVETASNAQSDKSSNKEATQAAAAITTSSSHEKKSDQTEEQAKSQKQKQNQKKRQKKQKNQKRRGDKKAAASANDGAMAAENAADREAEGNTNKNAASPYALYVANLPFAMSPSRLMTVFKPLNAVRAHVPRRMRQDGRFLSRGFGFVFFETEEARDAAMKTVANEEYFGGRKLVLNHATGVLRAKDGVPIGSKENDKSNANQEHAEKSDDDEGPEAEVLAS